MSYSISRQMPPANPANSVRDGFWFYAEPAAKLNIGLTMAYLANLQNIILGENCPAIKNANMISSSSFAMPVGIVFALGSHKKMCRIAARRIVALMAYAHSCWNTFISAKGIGHDMGQNNPASIPHIAVTIRSFARAPLPALVDSGNANLGPKPWNYFVWNRLPIYAF